MLFFFFFCSNPFSQGGFIFWCLFLFSIFMIGAVFGLLSFVLLVMITHQAAWFLANHAALYIMLSCFTLGGGWLAIKFQKFLIVISTAMQGAFSFMAAIDYFLDQGRAVLLIKSAFTHTFTTPVNCWYTDVVIAILPLMFCVGAWVQFKKTSVGHDHRKGTKYYVENNASEESMNLLSVNDEPEL